MALVALPDQEGFLKKITTKVTDANGGMHDPKQFKKAKEMLENCSYEKARLYHLSFYGAEQVAPYQAVMKALCARLRSYGSPCQWKACVEDDEAKGLHMHVFLLVEAAAYNPDHIINRKSDGWLTMTVTKEMIDFHLNPPRDPIHLGRDGTKRNYATLPKTKPAKLANCVEWISYLYKARSKPNMTHLYFSSRPTREKVTA